MNNLTNKIDNILSEKVTTKTVGDLIKILQKLPKDHEININVDNAYTSYIRSVYIDTYDKKKGRNVVTIKV